VEPFAALSYSQRYLSNLQLYFNLFYDKILRYLAVTYPEALVLKKCGHMPYLELFLIGATHSNSFRSFGWEVQSAPGACGKKKKLSNQSNFRFDLCEIRRKNKTQAQTEAARIRRVRFM